MQLTEIGKGCVTLTLDPGDCLALAQACRAQVNTDRARDVALTETLGVAFEALGLVGASYMDGGADFWKDFNRANVWAHHGPRATRDIGASHHTDLDGQRAEESAPACAGEAA